MKKAAAALGVLAALAGLAVALLAHGQSQWEAEGRTRWPMRGELVTRENGRALRVWCEGEGPRVILEASGLGGADQYERMIELLRARTRVCAYDRAGFGYSDARGGPTTLTALADDLWAVAEHAGKDPTLILVGASFGGLVVQYAARQHAGDVHGLVLLDAVTPGAFETLEGPWKTLDASLEKAGTAAKLGLLRRADPLHLGDSRAAWLTYRAGTWASVQALLSSRQGARALFEAAAPLPAAMPLRVFRHTRVGDLLGPDVSKEAHEAIEPKWQQLQAQLAASSTQGQIFAPDNVGHVVAHERPDLVAAQIEALVR